MTEKYPPPYSNPINSTLPINFIVWTQLLDIFRSMPRGIKLLKYQKYAKMLVNPVMCLSQAFAHQKNSGSSFCSCVADGKICKLEHKTTAFKVWMCHLICDTPVFLIGLALGIDLYLAQYSNIRTEPSKSLKIQ